MSDQNMKTFESRLSRINQMHASGTAFEATGTLGRSYFDANRRRARVRLPFRPIALILAAVLLFKATIFAQLGAEAYQQRIASLASASWPEQAAAWVLHADPATRKLSTFIQPIFH